MVSRSKLEFLQNLLGSDYVLCARGYGNYSHRLYEALACGASPCSSIPTACCRSISRSIGSDSVCGRSRSISAPWPTGWPSSTPPSRAEEFEELRVACRRLWEEWLSPEAFFANFHRHLE